jgi:tRNA A-37 threonylcarbamoyl transferase component Bud32
MGTERSDTYWRRLKYAIAAPAVAMALYLVAYGIRGVPESAELSFQRFPVVTLAAAAFVVAGLVGAPAAVYYISKDKAELTKEFPDVTARHWVTVAVFSYFSAGIYPIWYLIARWRKTKDGSASGSGSADQAAASGSSPPSPAATGPSTGGPRRRDGDRGRQRATIESEPAPDRDGQRSAAAGTDRPAASAPKGDTATPSDTATPNRDPGSDRPSGSTDRSRTVPGSESTSASASTARLGPPSEIPAPPSVSVAYDDLTMGERIGSGGNADVMRATLRGGVELAVKQPRVSGTLHADTVDRMLAEAETWDKLDDHDHVVGVVDYGGEPLPWIAMEYMDGGHLGERAGGADLQQALWTAIAVTKAVRHAHRRGVAHLDLKPENILFRSVEGAWDVPKVADWGLSKHLLDHSMTVDGLSPQYAAPEQFDDDRGPTDDITDVYQLGTVFYELFTGRPPFEGSQTQVMRATLHDRPTPPSDVADVPPALDDVLLTALATDRDDRYESVLLFRNALQELYRG